MVVYLFRTHRDRKTSGPVFLTKFDQKIEGLVQTSAAPLLESDLLLTIALARIAKSKTSLMPTVVHTLQ